MASLLGPSTIEIVEGTTRQYVLWLDEPAPQDTVIAISISGTPGAVTTTPSGTITILAGQISAVWSIAATDNAGTGDDTVTVQFSSLDLDPLIVAVNIEDDEALPPDRPTDIDLSGGTVIENATAGTVVGNLSADDPDLPGETFTYSLAEPSSLFDLVEVSPGNWQVVVKTGAQINYEALGGTVFLQVTVTDSDGNDFTKSLQINITDVNDNPPVLTSGGGNGNWTTHAAENALHISYQTTLDSNTLVFTDVQSGFASNALAIVAASDANGPVTYSIVGGADQAFFTLDATDDMVQSGSLVGTLYFKSGNITTLLDGRTSLADFENRVDSGANGVFQVVVRATNANGDYIDQTVSIVIDNDADEDLEFLDSHNGMYVYDQDEHVAGAIDTFRAVGGTGAAVTYSLAGANAALFSINQNTGALSLVDGIDYEANAGDYAAGNAYSVVIHATDGTKSADATVIVRIADLASNPAIIVPGPSQTDVTTLENNAFALDLIGTDGDPGAGLVWSIVSGGGAGADGARFAIDAETGVLSLIARPNYEAPTDANHDNVYVVTVRLRDNGGAGSFVQKTINVHVADAGEVNEFAANGTVAMVIGNPPSGNITYSLVNDAGGRFELVNGQIRVKYGLLLDYEQAKTHQVTWRETDSNNPGSPVDHVVTVQVRDINPETVTGNASSNTFVGGAGNDRLVGLAGADTVVGQAGNDILDGGDGVDQLNGGLGNDIYVLASGTDSVVDSGGVDTATSTVSRNIGSYTTIDNLTLLGTAVTGTGNARNNVLTGNSAANTLNGGLGNDTLIGGAGKDKLFGGAGGDTYVLANASDKVTDTGGIDTITSTITRSLAAYATIERLTLTGSAAVNGTGNARGNMLTGNAKVNVLDGGAGNDTLNGAGGRDRLIGGAGSDTFVLSNGNDRVSDTAGSDTITTTITRSLANYGTIEKLKLVGIGAINGTGNALNNTITGNAAANVLDGGTGNDKLMGGLGNDTYVLGSGSDTVSDTGGIDRITSTVSRSLEGYASIENLTLLGTAAVAAGNALNNALTGNAGDNTLNGGDGNDTLTGGAGKDALTGGAGNDTYVLADGNDQVIELTGTDTITSTISRSLATYGSVENLRLTGSGAVNGTGNSLSNSITGNGAANVLNGGAGSDLLRGGLGLDTLTGGSGADTFVFQAANESTGAKVDVITDFDDSGNDQIDLSGLAGTLIWQGSNALTGVGQVHIKDIAGPDVLVEVNLSGNTSPELTIRLTNTTLASMTASDFLL